MDESLGSLEERVDEFLFELGTWGVLDTELVEGNLDRLLATAPWAPPSANFGRRARIAMANAQSEREKRNPAVALGAVVGRARSQIKLGLVEVANHVGISAQLLEALEVGQLSARQILHNFPPTVAAQLLSAIGLAADEFANRLMDLAACGEKGPRVAIARAADLGRQRDTTALVMEVAEYAATLQCMVQSKDNVSQ